MKKLFTVISLVAFIGFIATPVLVSASNKASTSVNIDGKCPKCGKTDCNGSCAGVKDTTKCKGSNSGCCKDKKKDCKKSDSKTNCNKGSDSKKSSEPAK